MSKTLEEVRELPEIKKKLSPEALITLALYVDQKTQSAFQRGRYYHGSTELMQDRLDEIMIMISRLMNQED